METKLNAILPRSRPRLGAIRAAAMSIALAYALLSAQEASAQIDHSGGFADNSDLTANGGAYFSTYSAGTFARLTTGHGNQAASIFSNGQVDITSFTTTFTFDILNGGTLPNISDGLTFTIQDDPRGTMAVGPGGGGLGYGADMPGPIVPSAIHNSVCIKFDTFNNAGEGDNSTGMFTDGRSPTIAEPGSDDRNDPIDITVLNLKSQHPFTATMTYGGTALTVTITDTVTGSSVTNSYKVDIPSHVGGSTAYVGFTAGTGGTTAIEDIESWIFQSGM